MCFEYYQWKQRQDEMRRQELLDQKDSEERERERVQLERDEWVIPDEPVHIREKVPS